MIIAKPRTQEEDIQSLLVRVKYGDESIQDATCDILIDLEAAKMNGWDNAIEYVRTHPLSHKGENT